MTWPHKWVKSEQWGLSAESRLPWRLRGFVLHKTTHNDTVLHHSIQFSLFPKESNNYKIQDSSKIFYISFYFSIMGPVGLVCLQLTSTLSAGILISSSHYALYSFSVNFKWGGYGREWMVEGQKWETLKIAHTHYTICGILSHYPKAQLHTGKSIEWKLANSKLISIIWYNLTLRIQADHRLTSIPWSAQEEYCFTCCYTAKTYTHSMLLQIYSKWIKCLIYKCCLGPKYSELHALGICYETCQVGQDFYSLNCCKNIHIPRKHFGV